MSDAALQIASAHIHPDRVRISYSGTGEGRDWSQREWFRTAASDLAPFVTPVYRSAATDDCCFTVSAPVLDHLGELVAVLGADIKLKALLNRAKKAL
ncbi:MAG: PDC sensor domain-containing protein [Natronospirillum sp.]